MIYDVVIIGAGPVGLFAGSMGGYFGLKTLVIETSDKLGGQVTYLYLNKEIRDVPGYTSIKAKTYIQNLINQAQSYENVNIKQDVSIASYSRNEFNHFVLYDQNSEVIAETKYIIFAYGKGGYTPIRLDQLVAPDAINCQNILYSVHNDNIDFNNKKIVVLGGGDSALDNSVYLTDKFENVDVSLIVRNEIKGHSWSVNDLAVRNIKVFKQTKIKAVSPNELSLVQKSDENTTKEFTLDFDYILVQYGATMNADIVFKDWKSLSFDEKDRILVNSLNETSLANTYAIGDCCSFNSGLMAQDVYSIITGQADAFKVLKRIVLAMKNSEKNS
ncbi:NAD(P)/FAD-dependent oxidoreductase [Ureaplasma sp. ES3154-GEN]|uniref:NAD(P)/FAD-dependent oxidoreductase n=1 Tax=Ureaplasma sp. ES3154-GEN TaxID=2984844 RepID=UPI0021E7D16C|nr:NAD(P)/FAD-dependent oxidoreductase [Ureaplasma sp. ES3154-GEN]MCV3743419.1 NAD(P)/FAD-dependent oxidoreductase [Ureaplasma sp. ES3154-GEN]